MSFEDTMYTPSEEDNKESTEEYKIGGSPGAKKNTLANINFLSGSYYLPGDLVVGLPYVTIKREEFKELVRNGAKWSQLENYYQISVTYLKPHFEHVYNQAQAELEIRLLKSMSKNAEEGNASLLKWLSQNWLGMSEVTKEDSTPQLSEDQINEQLSALLNKKKDKND